MPSASYEPDRQTYVIRFRPPYATRQTRIRRRDLRNLAAARALAETLEAMSRTAETGNQAAVQYLLDEEAISREEATRITGRNVAGRGEGPLTLLAAFERSARGTRERLTDSASYDRHRAAVIEFTEWSGVQYLAELKRHHIRAWVSHLERNGRRPGKGLAPDTIRHRLLGLRYAAQEAPDEGFPDLLFGQSFTSVPGGLSVRSHAKADLQAGASSACSSTPQHAPHLHLQHVLALLKQFRQLPDHRPLCILLLGAVLGARPSEIHRARLSHWDPSPGWNIYSIGTQSRKNPYSLRHLPLPPGIIADLGRVPRQPADRYIIQSNHRARGPRMPLGRRSCLTLWQNAQANAIASDPQALKGCRIVDLASLRKTWRTIMEHAASDLSHLRRIERWMGHAIPTQAVTDAHYLRQDPQYLQPIADLIQETFYPEK